MDDKEFRKWLGIGEDTKAVGLPALADELIQIKSFLLAWAEITYDKPTLEKFMEIAFRHYCHFTGSPNTEQSSEDESSQQA